MSDHLTSTATSLDQPIRTSSYLGWNGIALAEYLRPAAEVAKPAYKDCVLCVYLGAGTDGAASAEPLLLRQFTGDARIRDYWQTPGKVTLTPPGQPSYWQFGRPVNSMHLDLPHEQFVRAASALESDPDHLELIANVNYEDSRLLHLALTLREETLATGPSGPLFAESIAAALAVHLLRHYAVTSKNRVPASTVRGLAASEVRRVNDYVRAHLNGALTLAEAAKLVHISPYHFARQFREATGQSFHQFVIVARVEEAKRLLIGPDLPAAQIAAMVGFSHQSHLALHLRRLTGLSPRAFRAQARSLHRAGTC